MSSRARKLLTIVALAAALLALAWAAFPAWAPWLAGYLLPRGWHVERLAIGRPGLREVRVHALNARGHFGPLRISVEAGEVVGRYAGPSFTLERLRIDTEVESIDRGDETSTPLDLDDLSVPRLPFPGDLPDISVGRLEFDTDLGAGADYLVAEDLAYGRETGDARLRADIGQLPLLAGGAVLEIDLAADSIQVTLTPAGATDHAPVMTYTQLAATGEAPSAGTGLQGILDLDIEFGLLDLQSVTARLEAAGLGALSSLSGNLAATVRFEGTESLRPRLARLTLARAEISAGEGGLAAGGGLNARWIDGKIEWDLEALEVQADGAFSPWRNMARRAAERAGVTVPPWTGPLALSLDSTGVAGRLGARHPWPLEARGDFALAWRLGEAAQGNLAFSGARWQSAGALETADSNFAARISGKAGLVGPVRLAMRADTLGTDRLDVEFEGQLEADHILGGRGRATFAGLKMPGTGVSMQRLDLRFAELQWPAGDATIEATTTGLQWTVDGARRSGADLDIKGRLAGAEALAGTGELLLGALYSLPFHLEARLADATARMRFDNAALPAGAVPALARPLAVPLPKVLAFRDGEIRLDGDATLLSTAAGPSVGGRIEARGDALVLALGETRVEGLDLAAVLDLEDVLRGRGNLGIETVRVAAGLDVSGVVTRFELAGMDRFDILDLGAGVLGGRLEADALSVADGRFGDAVIRWSGLDLGLLLAFLDVGGLDGTGRIDARFPLVAAEGGLEVRDGSYRATGPGRIRYRAGAPAANIGLQALENFQFDTLSGTVNYASDGSFTVTTDLLGRNPDLYGGHPIRFRLNIGGTLPALYRSMFITGSFEQAIIEQLRSERGEGELRP